MKTRCSIIGCILIIAGLALSTISNRLEEHNKKLFAEVEHHERYMDDIDRRASRASTPEQALKMYADERFSDYGKGYVRAHLKVQQEAFSGNLIYGLYSLGGISFLLGIVLLIVSFVLPGTTTVPAERTEQAIDRRVIELEAEKRFQEREELRQEEERKRAKKKERIQRQQEEKRRAKEQKKIEEAKEQEVLREERSRQLVESQRQRAVSLFQEALGLYTAHRIEEAWNCCNKSIKLLPHANTFLLRAWTWESAEEYKKMFDDCEEALRLNPELLEGRYTRGKSLLGMLNDNRIFPNENWLQMAIDDFESIPSSDQNYAEAQKKLQKLHSCQSQYDLIVKRGQFHFLYGVLASFASFVVLYLIYVLLSS